MKLINKIKFFALSLMLLLASGAEVFAQCPMCKAAAESNLKDGGTAAAGLNAGILYLFITPYVLVMVIGGIWYWKKKRLEKANQTSL